MPLSLVVNADSSGLESERPVATAVAAGYVYFATDINAYSVSDTFIWFNPTGMDAAELLATAGLAGTLTTGIVLADVTMLESGAPAPTASYDILYADSTAHRLKMTNNGGTADTVVGAATTDTLSNKSIGDPTDPTKKISFTLSGATAAKTATIISAHTDDRSLTLPNATDTLVGKATTDVFTNKTFSLSGAGNVTGDANGAITRFRRTLVFQVINVGNLADTNYVSNTVYQLPAGTMSVNGDRLQFDFTMIFSGTAATKTWAGNIGYTSWAADATGFTGGQAIFDTTTTTTTITTMVSGFIERLTSTTAATYGLSSKGSTMFVHPYTSFSITWANAQNILFEVKSSVGTADITTMKSLAITFIPYT